MNALKAITLSLCALLLAACGYHVGNSRNPGLGENKTFCVEMFENTSVYPMAGMQMTNALADALQTDGAFRMAACGSADMAVSGRVVSVAVSSLRTNPRDSYVSDEVCLTVRVEFKVTETRTGKELMKGVVSERASAANQLGNVQSARDDAVSWAVRQAASSIADRMTTP